LYGEFDEQVGALMDLSIEGDWPYLWIDAKYVKTRKFDQQYPVREAGS